MLRALLLVLLLPICTFANDYDKAWEALHQNNRKQALEYLEKAMKDPVSGVDAYLTYIYVKTFEGKEKQITDFDEKVLSKVKDPSAYLFALWFNGSALGDYGKKTEAHQIALLEKVLTDPRFNGSLKSAAHYFQGMNFFTSNQFQKAKTEWKQIGSDPVWQLAGPFENLSGSGFDKSYGPLEHPEKNAQFKSMTNALIQWFTPSYTNNDGWFFIQPHIPNTTAITYAQSFINAPEEMDVIANVGVNGAVKIWINDALIMSEERQRVTELDAYKSYCHLKKGFNRVLIQVAYTNNSIPNFIVRFTDETFNAIPNLSFTNQVQAYTKQIAGKEGIKFVPHFAEAYFEKKIKAEPGNLVNYILLSQTYLRNKKVFEARQILETALANDPDNSLLRFELMQCYVKEQNPTLLSEQVERIKEKDPGCYLVYSLKIDQLLKEEKYDEAGNLLKEMVTRYGEDVYTFSSRIKILDFQKKVEEELQVIQQAYAKYPDYTDFVRMMFNYKKGNNKDNKAAVEIYEKYLQNSFDYGIYRDLAQELIEEGKKEMGLAIMNDIVEKFPYAPDYRTEMAKYYFGQQDYAKALEHCKASLAIAPYVAVYWENKGVIEEQMARKEDAVQSFTKAIYYDSKRYDARKKLRVLQEKTDPYKIFPETDVYSLIQQSSKPVSPDYGYTYLLDEKQSIVYADGASEEYSTLVLKMYSQKGIDTWKDSYVPYNDYTQTLLIEKAEVVKKTGSKIKADQNQNEMVFTNLEVGDAIVIKYRIRNYASGRLAKEFWDSYMFDSFVPSDIRRYALLIDKNDNFNYQLTNSELKPVIREVDEFKLYTWEMKDLPAVKEEPYMPQLNDVGRVLQISTLKTWSEVAEWYSDLSKLHTNNEYELKEVYNRLFPKSEGNLTELDKAKRIYNYIENNFRYSSVSFRQSDYVPQKPSVTITSLLGDCKDLSSLFAALANMAGLKANLVLVNTRDNGTKAMLLPSVAFNHCIAFIKAEGKEYYVELTDNNLPFGSLPDKVVGASSLFIPGDQENKTITLQSITTPNRTESKASRTIDVGVSGSDLKVKVQVQKKGNLTSFTRSKYKDLGQDKQREEMETTVSGSFKNPVKLENIVFTGLDSLGDAVQYRYNYTVQNEIAEVGSINMFKIPFDDMIATIDNFSLDTRKFPVEYWRYEDADIYETTVNIQIPAGKQLMELPGNQSFKFKKNTYTISYLRKDKNKLTVTRKATLYKEDVSPTEYADMKKFLNAIIKIESKYIAFK